MKLAYIKNLNNGLAIVRVTSRNYPDFEEVTITECTLATSQLQAYCIINKIDKAFIERRSA